MTNEEKEAVITTALEKQDVFELKSVQNINHDPHPYMIGPKHIAHSTIIDESTLKAVGCAHPKCQLSYEEHTSQNVAFLSVIKDSTNDEANVALKGLVDELGEAFIDGFAFVESNFKIE